MRPLLTHPKDDLHHEKLTYYLLPTIYYQLPTTHYLLPTTYYLLSLLPIINNAYYPEICLKRPDVTMVFWAHFFRKLASRPILVRIYAERGGASQPAANLPRRRPIGPPA